MLEKQHQIVKGYGEAAKRFSGLWAPESGPASCPQDSRRMSLSRRNFRIVTGVGFFDYMRWPPRRGPKRVRAPPPALAVELLD